MLLPWLMDCSPVSIAVGDSLGVLPGSRYIRTDTLKVSIAVGDSLGVLRLESLVAGASRGGFNRGGRFFGGAAVVKLAEDLASFNVSIAVGDSLGVLHKVAAAETDADIGFNRGGRFFGGAAPPPLPR